MKKLKVPFGLSYDKWLHLLVGFMIGMVFIPNIFLGFGVYGYIFCGLVAVIKEIYDQVSKKGNAEVLDGVYTMICPTIIFIIHLIV